MATTKRTAATKAAAEKETAQAEKKTEVDHPKSTESQTDNRVAEFPATVAATR